MRKTIIAGTLVSLLLGAHSHAETMSISFSGAEIRTAPSTTSRILFSADRNYPLDVIAKEKEYYKVTDYRGRSGYIHKSLLQPEATVVVTGDRANVRSGPGTDNVIKFTLSKGQSARLIKTAEGWIEISTAEGQQGWIADFLVWGD